MTKSVDPVANAASSAAAAARRQRQRQIKDRLANLTIGLGGVSVILAIALIFFYLLFEVWPLLRGGEIERPAAPVATESPARFLDADEYNQSGIRILADGQWQQVEVASGRVTETHPLPLEANETVSSVQHGAVMSQQVGLGLSGGRLLVVQPAYAVSSSDAGREVTPSLKFPYGETPLAIRADGQPLSVFTLRGGEDKASVLAWTGQALELIDITAVADENAVADEEAGGLALELGGDDSAGSSHFEVTARQTLDFDGQQPRFMVFGQDGKWAYVFHDKDQVTVYDLRAGAPRKHQQLRVSEPGVEVTAVSALQGNVSLLVGDSRGQVSQWFMVRDAASGTDIYTLQRIRGVKLGDAAITALAPEVARKGFVAGDAAGNISYYYTTSQRLVVQAQAATTPVRVLSVSPRSEGVLVQSEDAYSFWKLDAEHPDISMSSSWQKVWYESYSAPEFAWQSSSGSSEFESKLSLMPLTFGTLKAAFYAMVLAAPLAICGAMYTAVFMAPGLRRKVKPAIELMQALPTVILGFLAGLWLAPTIEANLPGIFSLLILTPPVIVLVGLLWSRLPRERRAGLEGWAPVLLIVPILLVGWLSFSLSQPVENAFFGGDVRLWLETETGLKFDQRNSLIVGLAMGFAVIAPIFSISEDALFAVPRHLTNGSLALGATQWQTLVRVVLPTASPGIFSALMIGLGRAVGETMIVLMATGNTAVMEWNIFQGMRTLSANVAVEMGEAEVGSTHFRVLFLSALVLFVLTFFLNTIAEVVRTRLRKKYGSL